MKITVNRASATLQDLLSKADKDLIQEKLSELQPITVAIQNDSSNQVIWVETLGKEATGNTSRPITFSQSIQIVVNRTILQSISICGQADDMDVRVLLNSLQLND